MSDTALIEDPARRADRLPSARFLDELVEELECVHRDLLVLMRQIELAARTDEDPAGAGVMLAPTPLQHHASVILLRRYRGWCEKVRPFLERSPTAPVAELDDSFRTLS